MKNKSKFLLAALSFTLLLSSSCKKKDDIAPEQTRGSYVISATPEGTIGGAVDYVISASSLDSGTVSTTGNGIEQSGYRYYTYFKDKVFSLLYGQGNPGAVTTYQLDNEGRLNTHSNVQTESVHVFGVVNNELLLIKVPRSGDVNALFYRLDAENPKILTTKTIDIVKLAGNGERAHFTGAFQVDNKVYVPYMCIKGITGAQFHTQYTDSTWIAVFSYPELELEKVIKDNRTSYIGYYFAQSGLTKTENGDLYAFSTAVVDGTGITPSTNPSAAIRINRGQTEFDQSYFFNIQQASGGHHLYKSTYFGNGKFLLSMFANTGVTNGPKRYAVVDVNSQSFTWVTGLPDPSAMLSISMTPHVSSDGQKISLGITTSDATYIYRIDANTASATRGLRVISGSVSAIGELRTN